MHTVTGGISVRRVSRRMPHVLSRVGRTVVWPRGPDMRKSVLPENHGERVRRECSGLRSRIHLQNTSGWPGLGASCRLDESASAAGLLGSGFRPQGGLVRPARGPPPPASQTPMTPTSTRELLPVIIGVTRGISGEEHLPAGLRCYVPVGRRGVARRMLRATGDFSDDVNGRG